MMRNHEEEIEPPEDKEEDMEELPSSQ